MRSIGPVRPGALAVSALALLLTAASACVISFPDPPEPGGEGGRGGVIGTSTFTSEVSSGRAAVISAATHLHQSDALARCDGDEITSILDDPDNCGACGHMCEGPCEDGVCVGDE